MQSFSYLCSPFEKRSLSARRLKKGASPKSLANTVCPDGGIGRRAGLKHQCRKACRFDPGSGYKKADARHLLFLYPGAFIHPPSPLCRGSGAPSSLSTQASPFKDFARRCSALLPTQHLLFLYPGAGGSYSIRLVRKTGCTSPGRGDEERSEFSPPVSCEASTFRAHTPTSAWG